MKHTLTQSGLTDNLRRLCKRITETATYKDCEKHNRKPRIHGVPRGGVPVAMAVCGKIGAVPANSPAEADFIVDDIVDSGATMARYDPEFRGRFFALIDKRETDMPIGVRCNRNTWVVFPWEGDSVGGIEDNIRRLIQYVGDNADRPGLQETPKRVAKAWAEWCGGYGRKPSDVCKTFEDGAIDELVIVRDIPFYSHCEHHLAPFFGTVTIGYLPSGKIVGLSKLSRITDIFARRLQVQERLTQQIADALVALLNPKGVGVISTARHLCMESRGICKQGHSTTVNVLRGVFRDDPAARAEFLGMASGR